MWLSWAGPFVRKIAFLGRMVPMVLGGCLLVAAGAATPGSLAAQEALPATPRSR